MKHLILLPFLLATAAPVLAGTPAEPAVASWDFGRSDVPVDPAFHFGVLPNGMRYVLRENHQPEGTVMIRLRIGSGSLEERDEERGLAHYLEHMAFNGSRKVPEGEMIKLLEREGLAFGADTNASTGFEVTSYKLDLPRNDAKLIDTALMLMRETASELTISQEAVERERGVILAEKRDRMNYSVKETLDEWAFTTPGARYPERFPIGTDETLRAADAARLRGFYERAYVPANAVLIVVGAIDVPAIEKDIRARFGDWEPAAAPPKPETGPVDLERKGETDIYLDPALSERVTVTRLAPWVDEADSVAKRQRDLLRSIGYRAVNRRLETLARAEDAPFRGAGFGTGDIFESGRATNLVVDVVDGGWKRGLEAATREWRRALAYGFSPGEIAEQVARNRQSAENAAAAAATRSNAALVRAIEEMIDEEAVAATPANVLERFNAFAPSITPEAVLAALRADAAPLDEPLIRFQGRTAPEGGQNALRSAWGAVVAEAISAPDKAQSVEFAYTDFGAPGRVVSDTVDPRLEVREVVFANGVKLNLRKTELEDDRIRFQMALDGGDLVTTKDNPLALAMLGSMPAGGLGKHSADELTSILAGRSVGLTISARGDEFVSAGTTTPRDLELQLQLLAAALTDPGFRRDGEAAYKRGIANFFKQKDATPGGAYSSRIGAILSDDDPRFSLQPEGDYQKLSFAVLRDAISDRLANGAIELALVGDIDEADAIALVGRTLGALPQREAEFLPREAARIRPFTTDRSQRTVNHTGEADQAVIRMTWPTADDRDQALVLQLELLERVVRLELTEEIRERLGKAYSPGASSDASSTWRGYGTFALAASVDVGDVEATRGAIRAVIERLAAEPVSADLIDRARRPMLEAYDNQLKTNGGWMQLVARAQGESYRIDRFQRFKDLLTAITPADIQRVAATYLAPDAAVEVLVLPTAAPDIASAQ
ncbi:Protease 3 precursor [Tsuneonella dongtanensis]|uniref:Protease 3 n=1 Tax=Tsuneonella dongtanensis TaxID=692370 RepID=A0A1B2AGT3_9SPHN|nr:insulinase family protein [Tsuneonella dongtanensis]ANY21352.1 Protease 3 precursor [Tsuneonella dongtanensis]